MRGALLVPVVPQDLFRVVVKFSAVTIESLREKQWTRTGPPCLWACAARHLPPPRKCPGQHRSNSFHARRSCSPFAFKFFVLCGLALKGKSPSTDVFRGKEIFGQPRLPILDMCLAPRGQQFSPFRTLKATRKEIIGPLRLEQLYVSALSLTVDLHKFLQPKTMCSRILTLRSRTIITINSFLTVLKCNLPRRAKSQQNNSGVIWDTFSTTPLTAPCILSHNACHLRHTKETLRKGTLTCTLDTSLLTSQCVHRPFLCLQ